SFIQLDSASEFDVLSFDPGQKGRFVYRRFRRNPAGECLVWVGRTNIEKRVSAFRCEYLRNHSFNRRVFANVRCCFVCRYGYDNGRGLSVRNNEEGAEERD